MILVDTSSWVHQIRAKGDAAVRMRVEALLSGAQACELGDRARRAGISAGAGDLLIAACSRVHDVGLECADSDFDLLNRI